MINLLYSEIEDDLRATVRAVLASHSVWPDVLARTETDKTYDADLWRILAVDLGLAGLIAPESKGGAGAGYREAAVVCEELGRAVAPVPFLGSAVIAMTALLAADEGEPGAVDDLIRSVASGERTAVLAVPFTTPVGGGPLTVTVHDGVLRGAISNVADVLLADLLLVPTADGLFAVDVADLKTTPITSFDMTRQLSDVELDGTVGRLIANDAAPIVESALTAGAALLASEQLGVAEWCLDTTVEYLKTRRQFGRPIGSFQALKHRAADVYIDVAQARAVARYAADCAARRDPDVPVAVAVAQAFNPQAAVRAAEECLQLHGGIGFTWEYPVHMYLKRAKSTALAFRPSLERLADLADLPLG